MPEKIEVEEPNDENSVFVVDPDNYQKTKKLETIHKAKRRVLKTRSDRMDLIENYHDRVGRNKTGLDLYEMDIGKAVAQYGSELLPLIEESFQKDVLAEDDLKVSLSTSRTEMNVLTYIKFDGRIKYEDELQYPPEENALAIYRQLDRLQRKLGLGLELEEDKGPAEI